MKRINKDQARDYFAERVSTITKALLDMSDIIRRFPDKFNAEDVMKVDAYIQHQFSATRSALMLAVSTKVSTDFSFDMAMPKPGPAERAMTSIYPPTASPTPREELEARAAKAPAQQPVVERHAVPVREKPTGRLVKEAGGGVHKELVPLVPVRGANNEAAELTAEHDKTGGIIDSGFITE